MIENEYKELDKIISKGSKLALKKLIKQRADENGTLIFMEDGKIKKVSAKSLLAKSVKSS